MFVKVSVLALFLVCGALAYEDKTIAQYLTDQNYNTLVSLLKSANLYDVLNNQATGPFTVFAPTDAAFAKVPTATLQALGADQAALQSVLKFHVVQGSYILAPMITDGSSKTSLNGQKLMFAKSGQNITVSGAFITNSDQIVNNGVVHSIDTVLMPILKNIPELLLEKQAQFSTLNLLLSITDLEPALMKNNLTLFAPTDAAFNAIENSLPEFGGPAAIQAYAEILKNHIVQGTYHAADLTNGMELTTLHGQKITVNLTGGVMVGGANVVEADITGTNGVIHAIDGVLLPA